MKNYIFILFFLTINIPLIASPLHSKLKHSVIIDTDCNDSDLRAISLFLTHPGITVKAVIISNGRLPYEKGIKKIRSLLQRFEADSIPVAVGYGNSNKFPVAEILRASKEEMTLICLGPLTNISSEMADNADVHENIEEIIWYNESVDPLRGYNYESDKKAADALFQTGINIDIISGLNRDLKIFDKRFIENCKKSKTVLAKIFLTSLRQSTENEKHGQGEELAAVYMANPELMEMTQSEVRKNINTNRMHNIPAIIEAITDMLNGNYRSGHFIALYGFPVNRELYVYDIRNIMDQALMKYGIDEWKACVMTDEFHGHLGVFSIVGAKMGIYAREYFDVSTDLLEINTYAGTKPPFSCMNDGLQVSTGATLGQGTIHTVDDSISRPQAIFTYQDRSILIKLKPEYLQKLKSVIDEGVNNYGLEHEKYWTLVRQTTIRYWLEWDRKEIFDLIVL